jgi:hypothetical protein
MVRSVAAVGAGLALGFALAAISPAQGAAEPPDAPAWLEAEGDLLTGHRQLTFGTRFARAGEAYFSPAYGEDQPKWVIFQATERPAPGEARSPHYGMYVARLRWAGDEIVGLGEPTLLSPLGSANTCGWFHPTDEGVVMFGSTMVEPAGEDEPGYQRGTDRYRWAFPTEMEIVVGRFEETESGEARAVGGLTPMFEKAGYTAEGSWSPDGRFVLYGQVDREKSETLGRADADLWIYDTVGRTHTRVVEADGYDGGPFFDATGTRITYRSDRRGDNLLQLFTADLAFDRMTGAIIGAINEEQLTDNQDVNWAPYFHPGGGFLVFTGSQAGHFNYELFAIDATRDRAAGERRLRRVTHAPGFDGLAVFSPDGRWMMWTSQRAGSGAGDGDAAGGDAGGGTSQLWVARVRPTRRVVDRFLTEPGEMPMPSPRMDDDRN